MVTQWYQTPKGKWRLGMEKQLLKNSPFKNHELIVEPETENLLLKVIFKDPTRLKYLYVISVLFPQKYPAVHLYKAINIITPKLRSDSPHRYGDEGPICISNEVSGVLTTRSSAVTALHLAVDWIYTYEYWLLTGKWLGSNERNFHQ